MTSTSGSREAGPASGPSNWGHLSCSNCTARRTFAGGGFFARHTFLPLSIAWDTFREKNGAADYNTFRRQILRRRRSRSGAGEKDPVIGCIVLTAPFFFSEPDWIPIPQDWSPHIVQGKTYDLQEQAGTAPWQQVLDRLQQQQVLSLEPTFPVSPIPEQAVRFGEYVTRTRLGQSGFRALVTEAYHRQCAMTGAKTLPVLEAAHIKPITQSGPHRVDNGLLLRSDLHILFDRGYMTVTEDYHIEVSRRIKEEFDNGEEYYRMHGQKLLVLPGQEIERPSQEFVRWHNEQVYAA